MVLIIPELVFLPIPKTGSSWVKWVIKDQMKIPYQNYMEINHGHLSLSQFYTMFPQHKDRFKFSFVRNPITWYHSYWRFRMTIGWDMLEGFDAACTSDRFSIFIQKVIKRKTRYCGHMFEGIVGLPAHEIEYIGRYESLSEDLIHILQQFYVIDPKIIRQAPRRNTANPEYRGYYTKKLLEGLIEIEYDTFNRYGYSINPDDYPEWIAC